MANIKYIICPFYKSQGPCVIKCEGMADGKITSNWFETSAEKVEYRKAHCESFDYEKNCDVCRQLLKKYYKEEYSAGMDGGD